MDMRPPLSQRLVVGLFGGALMGALWALFDGVIPFLWGLGGVWSVLGYVWGVMAVGAVVGVMIQRGLLIGIVSGLILASVVIWGLSTGIVIGVVLGSTHMTLKAAFVRAGP